jgi:hypothetical protein
MNPDRISDWNALLASWTDFARRAASLPKTSQTARLQQVLPAIIGLQAITHAAAEIHELPEAEQIVGLDRADVLRIQYDAQVRAAWDDGFEELPNELLALLDDAVQAVKLARSGGFMWVVASDRFVVAHPEPLVAALTALKSSDGSSAFRGDLWVPTPGVPLFAGSPIAFVAGARGVTPGHEIVAITESWLEGGEGEFEPVGEHGWIFGMRQVYRQFDFRKGGPVRDVVVTMGEEPGGQALLVRAIKGGAAMPVHMMPKFNGKLPALPVEWADEAL